MELRINLANRAYLNRRAVRRWLLLLCGGLLLLVIFTLNELLTNYQQLRQVETRSAELDQQLVGLKGVSGHYSPENHGRVRRQVEIANQLIDGDRFQWTALLSRLEELVPADVSISSLQPDFKNHSVRVEAVARDVPAMTVFLDALLNSGDLDQVYLLRQAEAESRNTPQTLVRFSLEIREAF